MTRQTNPTHSDWPDTSIGPASKLDSVNAGVDTPSAPKQYSAIPISTKCSAMETISSGSIVASPRGS